MSQEEVEEVLAGWRARIGELEQKGEAIEERQDPMLKAEWDSVAERTAPEITKATLQRCIENVEDYQSIDDLLETIGEWRDEAEELNMGIREMGSVEFFRSDRQRHRFEKSVEELVAVLPDGLFDDCPLCGAEQRPTSDRRYNRGYRWECPECSY